MCALNGEYSSFKEARECKSLKHGGSSEVLASGKGDNSNVISEVSQTAKLCTDESAAADIRGIMNGMSMHISAKSKMIVIHYVDTAVIQRRLFILPGEVSLFV
jgi:hypothetical protein